MRKRETVLQFLHCSLTFIVFVPLFSTKPAIYHMYTKSEILYNRVTARFKIYCSHALFLIELHIQNPLNKIILNEIPFSP